MSLIRQVWLLILGVLLMALVGSLATLAYTTRDSLQTHLQVRNADAANMLALALSQQKGDAELMRLVVMAQFDTGHYRRIRLLGPDDAVLFEREAPASIGAAPPWFASLLELRAEPGLAQVSDGWRALGKLQVNAQTGWAVDALWQGCLRAVIWLALIGVAAAAVAWWAVNAWRKPLEATVAQAKALEEGRFVIAKEPRVPELQRLARSMNSLVNRLQLAFETQAEQVQTLRVQASTDPVTGLLHRRQFVNQMDAAMHQVPGRGGALLIVRVRDLAGLNQRIGHDGTDALLGVVAETLQAYPKRVNGALCGRLNGSDFGLFLPAQGLGEETAQSLVTGLRAALQAVDPAAEIVIGASDPVSGGSVVGALAAADSALAQAEAAGAYTVEVVPYEGHHGPLQGEQSWRDALKNALSGGHAELVQYPVVNAEGRVLHLECPLRMRLVPDGPFEPASVWLWMAMRVQMTARADLKALEMALVATTGDGRERCVHMAGPSLSTAGFITQVDRALESAPRAAGLLSIEINECVATDHTRYLDEASRQWRGHGTRLGLEHAGAALKGLAKLHEMGVDYIKIDDRYVHGVGSDVNVREFARSLVTMAHSMGVKVIAAGVDNPEDLATLWQLGFDGATGPAVKPARG